MLNLLLVDRQIIKKGKFDHKIQDSGPFIHLFIHFRFILLI